jgi:tRNA A37 threonylcarbamoyladenosine synthetase subunit TsaC/SUA5/YrdC
LTGARPDTIGVRVPAFAGPGAEVLARVGVLVATSANLPGEPDPHTLEAVPEELRAAASGSLVYTFGLSGAAEYYQLFSGSL